MTWRNMEVAEYLGQVKTAAAMYNNYLLDVERVLHEDPSADVSFAYDVCEGIIESCEDVLDFFDYYSGELDDRVAILYADNKKTDPGFALVMNDVEMRQQWVCQYADIFESIGERARNIYEQ